MKIGLRIAVIALAGVVPVQIVLADAEAEANSSNYFFSKYDNSDYGTTEYWNPANALSATFSFQAQAWNEGGTTGLLSRGPDTKFNNVGGAPADKLWFPSVQADVPAPGTSKAQGRASGAGTVLPGFVWGTNYFASPSAKCTVDASTIPAGGFGRGWAKTTDPWLIDLPYTSNANDVIEMHTFLEMTDSHATRSGNGNGQLGWHMSMDGISAFSSYLFDYQLSTDPGSFTSTLLVAPGVRLFLNDFSDALEFNTGTEVTVSQLKSYLDSFEGSGGWDPGSTPLRIGMLFAVPNDAAGMGGEEGMRHFMLHDDGWAQAEEAMPVPEPATLVLITLAIFLFVRRR